MGEPARSWWGRGIPPLVKPAAGFVLLPALHRTDHYPHALVWLAGVLWSLSAVATAGLAFELEAAKPLFAVAVLCYAAWTWGSAWWLSRRPEREPSKALIASAVP